MRILARRFAMAIALMAVAAAAARRKLVRQLQFRLSRCHCVLACRTGRLIRRESKHLPRGNLADRKIVRVRKVEVSGAVERQDATAARAPL